MLIAILSGFIVAFLAPFIYKLTKNLAGALLALLPASIFGYLCTYIPITITGQNYAFSYNWIPYLSLNLDFYIDGLSLFFGMLISGFGSLIILYTSSYLHGHKHLGRFYLYILLFMASMLGVVFSGNIICLFVFWELTSLSSFLLIGFNHEEAASRKSALQAMLTTVAGGFAMLAGLVLLGMATGTYQLPELLHKGELIREHANYLPIIGLILAGAFTKSAQFPFHFWLPNAMAAPTPVSAYLHSATMVKAGVYLVARFTPVIGNTIQWQLPIIIAGTITMLLGAWLAIQQTDMKKVLAYTTISALGMLFLMLGIGTTMAIQAALIFVLAHALYKGTLFLITGNVDHETGTREISKLSGLRRSMPFTGGATMLAAMSMAGVMPFFGFIGKEVIYEAALESTTYNILLLIAVIIAGALFVAIAIELAFKIFWGAPSETPKVPHEAPVAMLIAPITFSGLGLLLGIFAPLVIQPLLQSASQAVLLQVVPLKLSLWHGFNLILFLSLGTLLAGFILFRYRTSIRAIGNKFYKVSQYGPARAYEKGLKGIYSLATFHTKSLLTGHLRNYISVILSFFVLLMLYTIFNKHLDYSIFKTFLAINSITFYELAVLVFMLAGVLIVFLTQSRLSALAAMGVVGYGVAMIFIFYGGPDVAITQFLIETLTVVLFVLVLHKLPGFQIYTPRLKRAKYLLISVLFGALMTYILLAVSNYPLDSELKEFYAESSYPLAKGKNIVNVILVDFRGLDTMGESVVLAIAAIGIFSLLSLRIHNENQK